jgi:hypothetical protein
MMFVALGLWVDVDVVVVDVDVDGVVDLEVVSGSSAITFIEGMRTTPSARKAIASLEAMGLSEPAGR